jgi:prophage antirepressor-like protein
MIYDTINLKFRSRTVRAVVDTGGNVWFLACDLVTALGYVSTQAMETLIDAKDVDRQVVSVQKGRRRVILISDIGTRELAIRANTARSADFLNWLDQTAYPALRSSVDGVSDDSGKLILQSLREIKQARQGIADLTKHCQNLVSTYKAQLQLFMDDMYDEGLAA